MIRFCDFELGCDYVAGHEGFHGYAAALDRPAFLEWLEAVKQSVREEASPVDNSGA